MNTDYTCNKCGFKTTIDFPLCPKCKDPIWVQLGFTSIFDFTLSKLYRYKIDDEIKKLKESLREEAKNEFESLKSYMKIIILAGYTVFFGMFGLTKEYLVFSKIDLGPVAALGMVISGTVFVLVEINSMYRSIRYYSQKRNVIDRHKENPELLKEELNTIYSDFINRNYELIPLENILLWIQIVPGLVSVIILLIGYITHIFK